MTAKKKRKFARLRFPLLWIALVLLIGLSVNAYLALRPASVRAAVAAQLRGIFQPQVHVEHCTFGIRRGVEVRGLRVASPVSEAAASEAPQVFEGRVLQTPVLEAPNLRIIPDFGSLLRGEFRVKEIVVESPRLRLHRAGDGRWNFDGLFRPREGGASQLPRLVLRGATLVYQNDSTFDQPWKEVLGDLELELDATPHGMTFSCHATVEGVRKLELEGSLQRAEEPEKTRETWAGQIRLKALKIDLAERRERFLPAALARWLREGQLQGFLDLDTELQLDASGGLTPGPFSGQLVAGEMDIPETPFSVRNLSCTFSGNHERLTVGDIEGDFSGGALSGTAELVWKPTGLAVETWNSRLRIKRLPMDESFRSLLPVGQQPLFDEVRPQGLIGIDLRVSDGVEFPPLSGRVVAVARLEGVDLQLARLGYKLQNLRGELTLVGDRLSITYPIDGTDGDASFKISGPGLELREGGSVDVTVKVENLALDDRARSLMKPRGQRIWDGFRAQGAVDLTLNVTRSAGEPAAAGAGEPKPVRVFCTADSRGVRMLYERFPYEISGITGLATFDSRTRLLTFVDLKGTHGTQIAEGKGEVQFARPGQPGKLRLDLHSDSLVVDDDLRAALAPKAQALVNDFNFNGQVKANVTIYTADTVAETPAATDGRQRRRLEVVTSVELIDGQVKPKHFPYPLSLVAGEITVVGAQTMQFTGLRTAEDARPYVVFDGDLVTPDSGRELKFSFDVRELPFDEVLLEALPKELRDFVTNFGLEGVFNGKVEGQFRFGEDDPAKFGVIYHAYDVTTENAAVDFGLKIRRMKAQGHLVGRKEPGEPHFFLGDVMVDSALFNRLELTQGDIRFTYGREHDVIADARAGRIDAQKYRPPRWMEGRLTEDKVRNTFQMIVHSPQLYGGEVDGFLYVDTGELRDLGGHMVGRGLELSKAAVDVFGVAGTGTEGTASGSVSFSGKTGDLDSLIGEGEGKIEDAKLVELPLFFGILSLLFGETDKPYFNAVDLSFGIKDGKFIAPSEGVSIRSKALKLVGAGSLDFKGNIDLRLLPRLFSLKIIVLEQIAHLVKKGLAEIVVGGTLNDPKVGVATAGGLLQFDFDVGADGKGAPRLPSDQRSQKKPKGDR